MGANRQGSKVVLVVGAVAAFVGIGGARAQGAPPQPACGSGAFPQSCLDPQNDCDLAYLAEAANDAAHPCNGELDKHAALVAATMPVKTALTAPLSKAGVAIAPGAPSKLVHPVAADAAAQKTSGLDGSYVGDIERYMTCVPRYPTGTEPMSADSCYFTAKTFRSVRTAWASHGPAVYSCEEFAYKAYSDYSLFEDEVIKAGPGQHRQIFERAYATTRARVGAISVPPPYAIGTRGVAGGLLRDGDGKPLATAIPFQKQIPKNEYYRLPSAKPGPVIVVQGNLDSAPAMLEGGTLVQLKSLKRKTLSLYGLAFEDPTLQAEIDAGQAYYDESWAWHKEMSEKTAGFLDEELYSYEKKKEEYLTLLAERETLVEQILKMLGHRRYVIYNRAAEMTAAPYINLPKVGAPNVVQRAPGVVQLAPIRSTSAPGGATMFVGGGPNVADLPQLPAPGAGGATFLTAGTAPGAEAPATTKVIPNVAKVCPGGDSNVICLFYELEALDQRIEDSLQAARADGCVGGAQSSARRGQAPKCDWSPKVFTRRLLGLYQTERERAYRECLFYTAGETTAAGTFVLDEKPSVQNPKVKKNYNAGVTTVREFFVDLAAFWKDTVEKFGKIEDDAVVRSDGDQFTQGGEFFGAHLAYDAFVSVGSFKGGDECATTFAGKGSMNATATAFGEPIPLMDALVEASDTKYTAYFKVLGVTVLGSTDAHQLAVQPVNIVRDAFEAQESFVEVSMTVPIGPVPVSIGGGISGRVGLDYGVTAGRKTTAQGGKCLLAQAGVEGTIRPFAAVDGYVKAGISAVIISVGIKGTLTLIEASVPVTVGVGLVEEDGAPAIEMSSKADLRLTFLSGHISVYVEVGIWPAEATFDVELAGWDGIVKQIPLFSVTETAPLSVFQNVLAGPPSFEASLEASL